MKLRLISLLTAGAISLGASVSAKATELTFSSWAPATHTYMQYYLIPWMQEIEKASNGRITIKLLPQPVASAPAHLDAVRDGLVDIAFIGMGYYPGRFELYELTMMPFQAESAEIRGVAFQRTYDKFIAPKVDDFRDVKLLGSWAIGEGILWTRNRTVDSPETAKGAKVRISGGVALKVGEAMGLVPLVKPATEVYELLSGGIADGVLFPAEAICAFKLDEILNGATRVPGGLYGDSTSVIINKDTYAALSDEDRAIIDKYSGEYLAMMGGRAVDGRDTECWKQLNAKNMKVITADDKFQTFLRGLVDPMVANWKAKAAAAGIDGEAAVSYYFEQIEELKKVKN